ncbi:MAG: type IV toxin-antitoxin system AbiEi family antitoxin domain-containing protein [Atopobiaceae bacterium]|nr:type IV toxin-antitoxin system AbiEi family antitoxin domain-containing protein [Atopobiaceae bacterium]
MCVQYKHKKFENIRELEYLASSQWGLFTTAQAAALGVGRTQVSRMVGYGTIEPLRQGCMALLLSQADRGLATARASSRRGACVRDGGESPRHRELPRGPLHVHCPTAETNLHGAPLVPPLGARRA